MAKAKRNVGRVGGKAIEGQESAANKRLTLEHLQV